MDDKPVAELTGLEKKRAGLEAKIADLTAKLKDAKSKLINVENKISKSSVDVEFEAFKLLLNDDAALKTRLAEMVKLAQASKPKKGRPAGATKAAGKAAA